MAQLSPGPLSRVHTALEGAGSCLECHTPGRGAAAAKCLGCHRALGARIAAGEGLHARSGHGDCKTCHVEHQGAGFELVWWGEAGRDAFDHALTGHVLEGRHARIGCRDCHRPPLNPRKAALAAQGVDVTRTFLGLDAACTACHADPHRGEFADRVCTSCHTQIAWRPAPGFGHASTAWPLTGRHSSVECRECHRGRAADSADPAVGWVTFERADATECASCHEDVHRARLGRACASCHSPIGWRRVERAGFDHARTGYPLEGRHASVECDRWHEAAAVRRLRHERCTDCHRDAHLGQIADRKDGGACEPCHDVRGFSPARFGIADHAETDYSLAGAHLAVACNACHGPSSAEDLRGTPGVRVPAGAAGQGPRLRFASTRCATCHRDVHRGELDRWMTKSGCEACHGKETWSRAVFDHGLTRFALVGGHAGPACSDCHEKVEAGTPHERVGFAGTPIACEPCHGDPHRGQFTRSTPTGACERCHAPDTLRASRFDHARDSAWPLDGAHARVACSSCHRRETGDGVTFVRYTPVPKSCNACHGPARRRGKDVVSR